VTDLAVITPSFGPDAELFAHLHRSVIDYTSSDTVHHVIVPDADRTIFQRFEGPRCRLWLESELLPRRFVRVPRAGLWCNLRRPWPPIRGWVMQQALKIAAAGQVAADSILIADSDVVLVRPTKPESFTENGRLCLHRLDNAVHAGMRRHVLWHHAARRLLGLDPPPALPLPDYVSSLNVWDPRSVRAMQQRIQLATGRNWLDAFTAELHVSEFILYGVFKDAELDLTGRPHPLDPYFCHNYWTGDALDAEAARAFADALPPQAVGMMISAKSRTPMDARLAAIQRCASLGEQ